MNFGAYSGRTTANSRREPDTTGHGEGRGGVNNRRSGVRYAWSEVARPAGIEPATGGIEEHMTMATVVLTSHFVHDQVHTSHRDHAGSRHFMSRFMPHDAGARSSPAFVGRAGGASRSWREDAWHGIECV
jgi:hypothetical protein